MSVHLCSPHCTPSSWATPPKLTLAGTSRFALIQLPRDSSCPWGPSRCDCNIRAIQPLPQIGLW